MDSDDIALPNRISTQVSFLKQHSNIDVCGAFAKTFGETSTIFGYNVLQREKQKTRLLFENACLLHPSIMIRKSFIEKNKIRYDEKYRNCQDYKLWADIIDFADLYCVKKILMLYRLHKNQAGGEKNRSKSIFFANGVKKSQLQNLYSGFTEEELNIHFSISKIDTKVVPKVTLINYFNKLSDLNKIYGYFSQESLESELDYQWFLYSIKMLKNGDGRYFFSWRTLKIIKPKSLLLLLQSTVVLKLTKLYVLLKYKIAKRRIILDEDKGA